MPLKLPSFRSRREPYPVDLWTQCPDCQEMLFNKQLEKSLRVCASCGHHFRITARARLAQLLDPGSFVERDPGLVSVDPLGFVDRKAYPDRVADAQSATGLKDAAVWGVGALGGTRVSICALDFGFMGGSMGSVVGEKVTRAAEAALAERIPLVVVSASGGARMQEGTLALMQLAKTLAAIERLRIAGVPFVSILTDPTTGGVFASYAAVGDVNIAEPDALIGFAGARVSAGTIAEELPPGFQRSEFLLRHGFIDRIVARADLRDELVTLIALLRPRGARPVAHAGPDADAPGEGHLTTGPAEPRRTDPPAAGIRPGDAEPSAADGPPDAAESPTPPVAATPSDGGAATAPTPRPILPPLPADEADRAAAAAAVWARVQRARDPKRPHTLEILEGLADSFVELKGDRYFGDDEAIVCGLARIGDQRLVAIGHQKGAETDENIRRNFGMPHPEGYRKAMRLMELAERFGIPVVTLVDTPGAYPGTGSEERGVAEAIARSVALMTRLRTPIVVVITGEGGSGGALAIAVGDVVVALENAVYSVISPEGCASILWRTPEKSQAAALAMRMSAADQRALGVVDLVVDEPEGGAQADPAAAAAALRDVVGRELDRLTVIPVGELVNERYARYRTLGAMATVDVPAPAPVRGGIPARIRELRGIILARRAESARDRERAKADAQ
ncbi:MAG: acetyl-CoA carboxylase carboxyltransferase subunit alpha [Chloroflexi bacterium]|jgi:acetyl-CoA carboxylase carboxyl transferase subunit beta|nr:acetyl-CoA carboxylase carboxyltransferase subunit alpha [Chloroflexota bacterium]